MANIPTSDGIVAELVSTSTTYIVANISIANNDSLSSFEWIGIALSILMFIVCICTLICFVSHWNKKRKNSELNKINMIAKIPSVSNTVSGNVVEHQQNPKDLKEI